MSDGHESHLGQARHVIPHNYGKHMPYNYVGRQSSGMGSALCGDEAPRVGVGC